MKSVAVNYILPRFVHLSIKFFKKVCTFVCTLVSKLPLHLSKLLLHYENEKCQNPPKQKEKPPV